MLVPGSGMFQYSLGPEVARMIVVSVTGVAGYYINTEEGVRTYALDQRRPARLSRSSKV